ncbi:MAG: spike base protein, RCAP_Rcc01079 family [bacterium JZ-2024 1]
MPASFKKPAMTAWSATGAFSITPSDAADLASVPRGIYVGVSGDLRVDMSDSGTVTFKALSAGILHPISPKRVYSTGTTATDIIGVF